MVTEGMWVGGLLAHQGMCTDIVIIWDRIGGSQP